MVAVGKTEMTAVKEKQTKNISMMSMVKTFLPIVGLIIVFLVFNILTNFRMIKNMPLVLSQVYAMLC